MSESSTIDRAFTIEGLKYLEDQRNKIAEQYMGSIIGNLNGIFDVEILVSRFTSPDTLGDSYHIALNTSKGRTIVRLDTVERNSDKILLAMKNKIAETLLELISIPLSRELLREI